MRAPRHTPYDGSARLFEIGLRRLDLSEWIEAGDDLERLLAAKAQELATARDEIFAAEPGTEAAQAEVLALLAAHLPARFAGQYRRDGRHLRLPNGAAIDLEAAEPPLVIAARLVAEDLVLMRRGDAGWRLAAAAVAFPSSWRPAEKFGRLIDEVHAPVPGFGAGSRPAELIARMFDHLQPAVPVLRWNWSLYGDDRLAHRETAAADARRFGKDAASVFLRAERQTLRKLPQSGDILFTVRILVDPLAALERHSDGAAIAARLAAQLMALDADQLAYKGLSGERDAVVARLRAMASG